MSGRIVFFGNERLATGVQTTAPTLQALITAGYEVAAVVSNYEQATSRSKRDLEIAEVAKAHKIPLLLPKSPLEIKQQLADYKTEVAVLVAYGKIVPEEIINLFPKGIVNIHPSLLPKHRGPTPIESVILEGALETGVSVMRLVKAMDAGPVYGQSVLPLTGTETKQLLADKLLEIGSAMVVELLPGILDGTIVALPQDDTRATYDKLISKDDGLIDWTKPAVQLEREIRAFIEWPKSRTTLAGFEVIITGAHVEKLPADKQLPAGSVSIQEKQLVVNTGEGTLVLEKLKPAGKAEMTAQAFLAGYGKNFV